jgi:hypothetical protein
MAQSGLAYGTDEGSSPRAGELEDGAGAVGLCVADTDGAVAPTRWSACLSTPDRLGQVTIPLVRAVVSQSGNSLISSR